MEKTTDDNILTPSVEKYLRDWLGGVQYFRPGSRKDGGSHPTPKETAFAETGFEAS